MKLLLVVSEMTVGGAERVVVELARLRSELGDEVAVLAGPGPLDAELDGLGVVRAPLATGRSARPLLRAVRCGARLVRPFRPDIVHSHNVRVTAVARAAVHLGAPLARPPLVATYHGVPTQEAQGAARVLRLADRVACVSAGLRDQLVAHGFPADKVVVVPNGVAPPPALDAGRRASIDAELGLDGGPVIAVVGRLVPQKAHGLFLRAAADVLAEQADARFLVVGEGPLRHQLESGAAELGLSDAVRFTGVRPDAASLIARADMLVFSSVWEGLSIAALEALAAGVPVVSTDVAGTRELLASGAGVIVEHDAAALTRAMLDLVRDPQRRTTMGAEGRRLYRQRFSSEAMTEAYTAVYDQIRDRAGHASHGGRTF